MSFELYFNPACSKARAAKALLDERGVAYRLVEYLDAPPDRATLESILTRLGESDPRAIMRSKEAVYTELGLADADRDVLLDALAQHPRLLERPILLTGDRGVVARPPEKLLALIQDF